MWRTYTGANPLSTRNFNPGRTTVLSGAAGAAQKQTSSATWLSNLGAAISSLDKMNYEPSGVPANQHIYAANVRPGRRTFPGCAIRTASGVYYQRPLPSGGRYSNPSAMPNEGEVPTTPRHVLTAK